MLNIIANHESTTFNLITNNRKGRKGSLMERRYNRLIKIGLIFHSFLIAVSTYLYNLN